MDDDDPFKWISARCHVSKSQEEMLRNAPYVLPNFRVGSGANVEEKTSSEDEEAELSDMETIVMVSVSESSAEGIGEEEEEDYRTPPERHSHSLTSSNEARIGVGEDGGEDEVDCGGGEDRDKTVDLSRDSEVDGCEFRAKKCKDGLVEKGECLPRAAVVSESVVLGDSVADGVDSLHIGTNITVEEEGGRREGRVFNKCVEDNVMDKDVKMAEDVEPSTGGGVTTRVEERQEDTRVVGGSHNYVEHNAMDEDLMMVEEEVPSTDCGGVTRGVEAVAEGNHGSSLKTEITRIFGDNEIESGICARDVGVGKVNELQYEGKDVVEEVERVRCAARACVSGNASLKFRKLPSSFCIGGKGDGGEGTGEGSGRVTTDKGDDGGSGAGICGGSDSAWTGKGDNEPGDADGGAGKKASEPNVNEEPNEKEQTENILKVLGFLAKPQKPVYKEKVDIIGSAIKAGLTFPRPSWWAEDSDDDSD